MAVYGAGTRHCREEAQLSLTWIQFLRQSCHNLHLCRLTSLNETGHNRILWYTNSSVHNGRKGVQVTPLPRA